MTNWSRSLWRQTYTKMSIEFAKNKARLSSFIVCISNCSSQPKAQRLLGAKKRGGLSDSKQCIFLSTYGTEFLLAKAKIIWHEKSPRHWSSMHEELFIEMCLEIAYQLHSLSVNCYFKNEENMTSKVLEQELAMGC